MVVPARGGSKGIPAKNLREVCGFPLVGIVGRVVKQLDWVDRCVVSTDDDAIADAAEAEGVGAPFRRPESLSGDRIGDWDVLAHALREMDQQDSKSYDVVVMLQPTSPLRTPAQVEATVRKLIEGDFDAVWTVSETDVKAHPLKQLVVDEESGAMDYFDPRGAEVIARQQLTPVFHRNGVAYALTRRCLLELGNIKGEKSGAVVVRDPVANIDTPEDLKAAESDARALQLTWLV